MAKKNTGREKVIYIGDKLNIQNKALPRKPAPGKVIENQNKPVEPPPKKK